MPVHPDAVDTMNQILAGWLGPNRGTGSPDAYDVRLWQDDPRTISPTEADWGGYPAGGVEWSSDDWATPASGGVDSDGFVDFGATSSAGTDAARYWALHDTTTGDVCFSAPLEQPLHVSGAGTPVLIRLTVNVIP
jgi:hypothetical protein